MFEGYGWFRLITEMHSAFVAWLYPIMALYIILYVINLIIYLVFGSKKHV